MSNKRKSYCRRDSRLIAAAAFSLACVSIAGAAEPAGPAAAGPAAKPEAKPDAKPVVLPAVVVTATRVETEPWRTASSISTIDQEKIEAAQYRTVTDAVREVPGLTIADRGTPGSPAGVFLRGTKTEHTALLINGRPAPANLAGSFNLETAPLANVERIEVLRGPASSLYGGKTIGGAINIITRDGRDVEKPEFKLWAEGGSFETFRESVSTLGNAGPIDWSLEGTRLDSDGPRVNSDIQQTNAGGRFGVQLADSLRIELDTGYYDAEFGVPGPEYPATPLTPYYPGDPDDHLHTENWSVAPRIIWDTTDWWQQSLTWSYNKFRQVASNFTPGYGLNNRADVENHFWEYQSVFRPAEHWSITAGAWLQDQNYTRFDDEKFVYDVDQNEFNWAGYLQTQAEIAKGLNVVGGFRYDDYSDFGSKPTFRVGASYKLPVINTLLHANYGTAFAPPSPQDREPALYGNPALLEPEESQGYEVGITQPLFDEALSLGVTWFENDIENLIEYDPTRYVLEQIDDARTHGIETALNWKPCGFFGLDASYTWLEAENLTDSRRLIRRPTHTFTGGFWAKPVESVRLGMQALYVVGREDGFGSGQQDMEDYVTVRATASWQVSDNFEVFGRVENLFDEDYEEVLGFPGTGLAAYAGLSFKF